MSEIKKMKAKMIYKFRGDTIDNWENSNPILSAREPGLVIDESGKTIAFKIGDGVTVWNELEYHNIDNGGSGGNIDPEIFQRKLELWQPNTEYKVGDVVVAFYAPGISSGISRVELTFIAKCATAHTSSDSFGVDLNTLDVWNVMIVNAYSALYDRLGNLIDETYATKEELTKLVGDIENAFNELHAYAQALITGGDT